MDDINRYIKQENSLGIKKIVDCKIENGQQMYKVKWEPTWEPAGNLMACQNLVDEFWSRINQLKTKEGRAVQDRIEIRLENLTDTTNNNYQLSHDFKSRIDHLINRTNATTVGIDIVTPSCHFSSMQNDKQRTLQGQIVDQKVINMSSRMSNAGFSVKPLNNNTSSGGIASLLSQIKSFEHPYVKALLVCIICNKDQTARSGSHWKMHFLTHSEVKPFNCPHCSRGFVRPDKLRNHINLRHSDLNDTTKEEEQVLLY